MRSRYGDSRRSYALASIRFPTAIALVLLTALALACGCSRWRMAVDLVPAEDALTETVVMEDDSAGWRSDAIHLIDVRGLIVDAQRPEFPAPGANPLARYAGDSKEKAEVSSHEEHEGHGESEKADTHAAKPAKSSHGSSSSSHGKSSHATAEKSAHGGH